MKKVLITGASGFVGGYLAEHLLKLGDYDIYGTYLSEKSKEESPVREKIHFIQADLQNKEQTERLIEEVKPEFVYHLAAMASVRTSFSDPIGTFHANIDAQLHLFEALRKYELLNTRILIVGSAEEYGYVTPEDIPVDENTPLRPANPYSVSKIAQDFLGMQYFISYKMPIIRIRPFNHVGPRQSTGFVLSDFAKQVAEIEKGKMEPHIKVGNMEVKRDFTDVRDMVKVYPLVLEKGNPGEVYNAGSGTSHQIQEIMDLLISSAHIAITLESDLTKFRPSDVPEIVADNTKITTLTGWKPEISFEQTVKDTLDYWRNIV